MFLKLYSIELNDPSNLAELPSGSANFTADAALPHAEAGVVLSAGGSASAVTLSWMFRNW
ncbi:MAG: hypothetical protein M0033_09920 [Nitrospiraceae bacterium]|nr:hypothetical protein [Nitrospiraceae bacterium]